VQAAVAGLDPSEQDLIHLMFWEHRTLHEAALTLKLRSDAAKELKTAALKKLQTALAKPEESDDDDDEYD
jgi:DNA-directed RNA polymerase specialized sigma24 family protein